jgi:hypothetical protein
VTAEQRAERREQARCAGAEQTLLALAVWVVLLGPWASMAEAQESPLVVWTLGEPALAGRAELWARRVERALERDGAPVVTDPETWAYAPSGLSRDALGEVDAVELLLFLARTRASDLDERGALAALVEAERRSEGLVALAGGAAWYAEVEVQIAIAAFQLGEPGLARAALERAASIDPRRLIRPAEAPPELVELARRAVLSARAAPVSSFEVHAEGVVGAQVFVDDEAAGTAPVRVEMGAGLHALRVEARGHRPWASLVRVLPGTRADVDVVLSPEPAVELARSLRAAVSRGELSAVPPLLGALASAGVELDRLVLTAVGEGAFDRALLVSCDSDACVVVQRLEGDLPASRRELDRSHGEPIASELRWLEEVPFVGPIDEGLIEDGPTSTPLWQEPWPWLVLGGVAIGVGAAVTAGVLVDEESRRLHGDIVIELPSL